MEDLRNEMPSLPQGIRGIIYSYFDFKTLVTKIAKLNSSEKELICRSELLD